MMLNSKLQNIQDEVSSFIASKVDSGELFEHRMFYGESFSSLLLADTGKLTTELLSSLCVSYRDKDKRDSQFHWEFNNYAWMKLQNLVDDKNIKEFTSPLIFKGTPCTNWTLLRCNGMLLAKSDVARAIEEAKGILKQHQDRSGLICDDRGVHSFQYHCFSAAMTIELYEISGDDFFLRAFLRAVKFIRNFILPNGDTLYIGRGQQQSFGYGTLIYILSKCYEITAEKTLLGDISLVLDYLKRFQRVDGSFPLTMNSIEKDIPKRNHMDDSQFLGWYPYNNYYDYLPFFGYFISQAQKVLSKYSSLEVEFKNQKPYRDKNYIKVVKCNYIAVVARPTGYWTNDMTIPYLYSRGESVTPCYGGEQFQKSLYDVTQLPVPITKNMKFSMRKRSRSTFLGEGVLLVSPLGAHYRSYRFGESSVEIIDKGVSFVPLVGQIALPMTCSQKSDFSYSNNQLKVVSRRKFISEGVGYSASGKYRCVRTPLFNQFKMELM